MSEPAAIDEIAAELADGVDATIATWVVTSVQSILAAWSGAVDPDVARLAEEAGQRARSDVAPALRALLEADIDDQRSTPLTIVRAATRYPTEVLRAAGVPPVERDPFREAALPDDVYDLSPASFADIDPLLGEVAIRWGAAKAFEHKRRHR